MLADRPLTVVTKRTTPGVPVGAHQGVRPPPPGAGGVANGQVTRPPPSGVVRGTGTDATRRLRRAIPSCPQGIRPQDTPRAIHPSRRRGTCHTQHPPLVLPDVVLDAYARLSMGLPDGWWWAAAMHAPGSDDGVSPLMECHTQSPGQHGCRVALDAEEAFLSFPDPERVTNDVGGAYPCCTSVWRLLPPRGKDRGGGSAISRSMGMGKWQRSQQEIPGPLRPARPQTFPGYADRSSNYCRATPAKRENPALVLAAGAGGLNAVRGPGSPPSPAPGGGNRGRAPGAGQHRPRGTGSGARAWRHVAVALVLGAETLTAGVAQCSGRASSQRSGCWLRFGCDVQPRTNSGAGGTRRRPSLGATPGNPDGPAMRSVSCGPRCQ